MGTAIIVGAIWVSLIVVGLLFNYRFHRLHLAKMTRNLLPKASRQEKRVMNGARN